MKAGPLDTSKRLVTIPTAGHGAFFSDECARSVVRDFLREGIESIDDSCATGQEVDFNFTYQSRVFEAVFKVSTLR